MEIAKTVKDVSPHDFNKHYASHLKRSRKGVAVNGLQIPAYISSDSDLNRKKSTKLHSGNKRKSPPIANDEIEGKRSPEKAHETHVSTIEIASTKKHKSSTNGSLSKPKNSTDKKRKGKKSSATSEESDSNGLENQNQNQSLSQNFINMKSHYNSEDGSEVASQIGKPNEGVDKQPNNDALWTQKSSWTDLVGGTNASFSISQLLPDTKFEEKEQIDQTKNWFAAKTTIDKPTEIVNKSTDGLAVSVVGFKSSLGVGKERAIRAPIKYSIGETCSFMRSDASMKEWKSIKAALSSSLRKKIDKKKQLIFIYRTFRLHGEISFADAKWRSSVASLTIEAKRTILVVVSRWWWSGQRTESIGIFYDRIGAAYYANKWFYVMVYIGTTVSF